MTERTARHRQRIEALIKQGEAWAGKPDDLKIGIRYEGRKVFESSAKARLFHAMSETHLLHILELDMTAEQFCYDFSERAQAGLGAERQPVSDHRAGKYVGKIVCSGLKNLAITGGGGVFCTSGHHEHAGVRPAVGRNAVIEAFPT